MSCGLEPCFFMLGIAIGRARERKVNGVESGLSFDLGHRVDDGAVWCGQIYGVYRGGWDNGCQGFDREFGGLWLLCVPITEPQQPPRSSVSRADGYRQPLGLVQSGMGSSRPGCEDKLKGQGGGGRSEMEKEARSCGMRLRSAGVESCQGGSPLTVDHSRVSKRRSLFLFWLEIVGSWAPDIALCLRHQR